MATPNLFYSDMTPGDGNSCATCVSREGRSDYCLLHSCQVRNMDSVICADWVEKAEPTREQQAGETTPVNAL